MSGSSENPSTNPTGADNETNSTESDEREDEVYCNTIGHIQLAIYDPPKWGWSAIGGINDLLSPLERSRRYETRAKYLKNVRFRSSEASEDITKISGKNNDEVIKKDVIQPSNVAQPSDVTTDILIDKKEKCNSSDTLANNKKKDEQKSEDASLETPPTKDELEAKNDENSAQKKTPPREKDNNVSTTTDIDLQHVNNNECRDEEEIASKEAKDENDDADKKNERTNNKCEDDIEIFSKRSKHENDDGEKKNEQTKTKCKAEDKIASKKTNDENIDEEKKNERTKTKCEDDEETTFEKANDEDTDEKMKNKRTKVNTPSISLRGKNKSVDIVDSIQVVQNPKSTKTKKVKYSLGESERKSIPIEVNTGKKKIQRGRLRKREASSSMNTDDQGSMKKGRRRRGRSQSKITDFHPTCRGGFCSGLRVLVKHGVCVGEPYIEKKSISTGEESSKIKEACPDDVDEESRFDASSAVVLVRNGVCVGEKYIENKSFSTDKEVSKSNEACTDHKIAKGTGVEQTSTDENVGEESMIEPTCVDDNAVTESGIEQTSINQNIGKGVIDTTCAVKDVEDGSSINLASSEQLSAESKLTNTPKELDIYKYHRGRVGEEIRNEVTGELLCDVPETDTNHHWDPKLTLNIKIEFPLSDPDEEMEPSCKNSSLREILESSEKSSSSRSLRGGTLRHTILPTKPTKKKDTDLFFETICWDLEDPSTPSPMLYATTIASQFGLSYGQMLDLANSIQQQIDSFISSYTYRPPVTCTDPFGTKRPKVTSMPSRHVAATPKQKNRNQSKNAKPASSSKASGQRRTGSRFAHTFVTGKELRDEVLRRVKIECRDDFEKGSKQAKVVRNAVCHICHARKDFGVLFPCGISQHVYCDSHCQSRLGFSHAQITSQELKLDTCPMCCLSCACPKCGRRLDKVAAEFECECKLQKKEIADCELKVLMLCNGNEKIFEKKHKVAASTNESSGPTKQICAEVPKTTRKRKSASKQLSFTPKKNQESGKSFKVDPDLLPYEICENRNLDPWSKDDYYTIYGPEGKVKVISPQEAEDVGNKVAKDSTIMEGNNEYCSVCRRGGNLLCCEQCPRAFHGKCIDTKSNALPKIWICHICKRENDIQPEDKMDGTLSLKFVTPALSEYSNFPQYPEKLITIAKIHEMLQYLIGYDFGSLFQEPVNLEEYSDYTENVRHPMDLGTIASNIVNGKYIKEQPPSENPDENLAFVESMLFNVLKDIELVWHNCFTYNPKSTTAYRMASVQRQKFLNIRRCCIDMDLDEATVQKLKDVVLTFEKERENDNEGSSVTVYKHVIKVNRCATGKKRCVAVFDPETSRIVKLYTTLRAAIEAISYLQDRGLPSEFSITTITCQQFIRVSHEHPNLTCYGYRWVFFDDLKKGGVVQFVSPSTKAVTKKLQTKPHKNKKLSATSNYLAKSDPTFIERKAKNGKLTTFSCVAEAYEDVKSEMKIHFGDFDKMLCSCPDDQYILIGEDEWRRCVHQNTVQDSTPKTKKLKIHRGSNGSLHGSNSYSKNDLPSIYADSVLIIKENAITGTKLMGFDTRESAFNDWLETRKSSSEVLPTDDSQAAFEKMFLGGDCNIGGVRWVLLERESNKSKIETANEEVKKSTSDVEAIPCTGDQGNVSTNSDFSMEGNSSANTTNAGNGDNCVAMGKEHSADSAEEKESDATVVDGEAKVSNEAETMSFATHPPPDSKPASKITEGSVTSEEEKTDGYGSDRTPVATFEPCELTPPRTTETTTGDDDLLKAPVKRLDLDIEMDQEMCAAAMRAAQEFPYVEPNKKDKRPKIKLSAICPRTLKVVKEYPSVNATVKALDVSASFFDPRWRKRKLVKDMLFVNTNEKDEILEAMRDAVKKLAPDGSPT